MDALDSSRDARVAAIMDDVMRRSFADFKKIDEQKIDEEHDNQMALVLVDSEVEKKQRKHRNELLKMKAKAITAGQPGPNKQGKVIFDVDADDAGTFVTGLGIPGTSKQRSHA